MPTTLRWAVWLLYLEAAAAVVLAAVLGYAVATQPAVSLSSALATVGFTVGLAVLLAALGLLLSRRRSPARGPAIVLELLLLPVGYYMVTGGVAWFGVPVILLGLACSVLLFAPSTREFLGIR
ncbi:MAG: hypothetical protein J2P15_21905 [Micromonosporaceae bacterium]|nr:hypothetical protein [Micromonosporaceae bacterium]